jgi:hypothetical protein
MDSTITVTCEPPAPPVLRVTVSGGGPVGLVFALMLDDFMGDRAAITVHDGRWTREGGGNDTGDVIWKAMGRGSSRRQQVVTIQSRQWSKLSATIQGRLFGPGAFTEMWPTGPDSVDGLPPRNIRIAYIEDQLLALADERSDRIRLVPQTFDVNSVGVLDQEHVLAICGGKRSRSREQFAGSFGAADTTMYALDGQQVQDVLLGMRVRSHIDWLIAPDSETAGSVRPVA